MAADPIAIVGFAFRLPGGAHNVDRLWEILANGEQAWADVPESRYNWKAFHNPNSDARGTHNSRGGFFLQQHVAEFDARFFGIPDAEAEAIDPQQRLLLEVSYEALENAGMPVEGLTGSQTGVYIALVSRDYDRQIYKDPSQIPKHHLTGCGDATACGRISYVFNFKGPSMTLDTGCSGGMVGVHLACSALKLGESDMALVGGANLLLGPDMTLAMSNLHMVNDNGRCYPFDSRGAGYGRAEGVAVMVLKRLSDARKDGDAVRAIILGSGVGQDGKTNGILLPSSQAQQDLVTSLYWWCNIDPQTVAHVEMHGTGTAAGDAAEIRSIREAFIGDGTRRTHPLSVGSIKANLGHSESTSGLSGILSAVLSMEKNYIPPVAALQSLKPDVVAAAQDGFIQVPQTLQRWPPGAPKRASVNSFGFGGTNAHVILDVPSPKSFAGINGRLNGDSNGLTRNHVSDKLQPSTNGILHPLQNGVHPAAKDSDDEACLLILSAKSRESLSTSINNLRQWLKTRASRPQMLYDLSRTLATRRSAFAWRTSVAVTGHLDAIGALENARLNKSFANSKTVFLFTGQGAQYAAMGRELLQLDTNFYRSLERSRTILQGLGASWDLLEELRKPVSESRINHSHLSQPATTACQIALVSLLGQAGVHPTAALGHSSGEVAAAYAVGSLSHEDAIRISYHKGFVADWCRETIKGKGAMLAVGLAEADVDKYLQGILSGRASVACVNSPSSVTISGDEVAIEDLRILLDRDSIFNRRLKVDIAYHSHHMQSVAARFEGCIHDVPAEPPNAKIKFFSSVTGQEWQRELDASYWVENLVSKVRFSEALECLATACGAEGQDLNLVEIGPHSALEGPIRQTMSTLGATRTKWTYLPSLVRGRDSSVTVLDLIGRLWQQGLPIDLSQVLSFRLLHETPRPFNHITDLPAYAWDHNKRYWHESRLSSDYRFREHAPHDLLGLRLVGSTLIEPVFRLVVSLDDLPWLQEHTIDGVALYPGSAFLVHAIEGLKQVIKDRGEKRRIQRYWFRNVSFTKSIVVPDSPATVEVLVSIKPSGNTVKDSGIAWQDFRITSQASDGKWNDNCHGLVGCELASEDVLLNHDEIEQTLAATRERQARESCSQSITGRALYDSLRENGIDYGENFTIIQQVKIGEHVAVGDIIVPNVAKCMPSGSMQDHVVHPATFDAFMHIALPLYHRFCSNGPVVLTSIGEVSISADILSRPGSNFTVVCDLAQLGSKSGAVNVSVLQQGAQGNLVEVGTLTREEFQSIGDGFVKSEGTSSARATSCKIDWQQLSLDSPILSKRPDRKVDVFGLYQSESLLPTAEAVSATLNQFFESSFLSPDQFLARKGSIQVVLTGPYDSQEASSKDSGAFAELESVLWVQLTHRGTPGACFPGKARRRGNNQDRGRHIVLNCKDDLGGHNLGQLVAKLLFIAFNNDEPEHPFDMEYWYHHGTLYVPRLRIHEETNSWLKGTSCKDQMAPFHGGKAIKHTFKTPGLLSNGHFIPDTAAELPLGANDMEIKIHARAVNPTDVAAALGKLGVGESSAGEFAGVVLKVGSAVPSTFKPGDRVCGLGASGFSNIARVRHHFVQRLDNFESFSVGAAIPVAFQTALHALQNTAHLKKEHRLLIHGAVSDVGQAAISLAQRIGAEVYATASTSDEVSLLSDTIGLPRNRILSARDGTFQRRVRTLTSGNGVELILNCGHPELVSPSMPCLAESGMAITVGKAPSDILVSGCRANISCVWIDMNALRVEQPQRLEKLFSEAMELYRAGQLRLPIHNILPIVELEKAFRLANSENHLGKIIVEADNQVSVLQSGISRKTPQLGDDRAYAVLGGSPELNEELCSYLAKRGSKKILTIMSTQPGVQLNSEPLQELWQEGVSCERLEIDAFGPWEASPEFGVLRDRLQTVKGVLVVEPTVHQGEIPGESGDQGLASVLQLVPSGTLDFIITLSQSPSLAEASLAFVAHKAWSHNALRSEARSFRLWTLPLESSGRSDTYRDDAESNLAFDEVRTLLDYSIGKVDEQQDPSTLFLVPLQDGAYDPRDAFFEDVPQGCLDALATPDGEQAGSIESQLRKAADLEAAHALIGAAICDQLASFCAIDRDDIRMDAPIADVGLDSLLAIEFKNWIVRAFKAPMQTTEIINAPSLLTIVALVAQRLKLGEQMSDQYNETAAVLHTQTDASPSSKQEQSISGISNLPPLPLPSLEDLMKKYVEGVRAFASEEEYQNTLHLAKEFSTPGSAGARLYGKMQVIKATDPENWYHDLFLRNQYLIRKGALAPFMLFFCTHPLSPIRHPQADRAALIASVLIRFKRELEAGLVKPRYINEQPLCMDLYKNLFSACREPRIGEDVFHAHPGNNFFVVLRAGRAYKVDFSALPDSNMFQALEASMSSILAAAPHEVDWLGVLTTEHRVSWATNYQKFLDSSDQNVEYVRTMQRSAFILCLDNSGPETAEERARQVHFGDGSNRWFDKTVQYVVFSNGVSGMVADHTGLDAPNVADINLRIAAAIREHDPATIQRTMKGIPVDSVKHAGFPELDDSIEQARLIYQQVIVRKQHFFHLIGFGSSFMRKHKVSANSGAQVMIQLASRYYFGYLPACWETILQMMFHKGRVEINPAISVEVAEFVQSAADDSTPLAECRRKFFAAARKHSGNILVATQTGGFDRFLSLLRELSRDGEGDPELYRDPVYQRARPRKIVSNSFKTHTLENGCTMRDDEGYFVHYELDDESIKICGQGPTGETKRFVAALQRAERRVRAILDGEINGYGKNGV